MDRYGKKLLILFSCLAGIIVILASSLFLVSWFWSNQIVQKSLDSEYTDNKSSLASSAAEDTKNNVDQDSDNKKLTQEEKDKMVAEGIGSLEDGTRSVVVNLADINLSDLKEANPEVLDSKLNQILAEANDANSQNNKISDEYKKAVALKQNKFLAQLSKSSGKISVSAKYKTIPSMVFTVDYGGLNSINSSDLVNSMEDDKVVFATSIAGDVTLNPNPIAVMGGSAAAGFTLNNTQYNGSNYAVAILDTGIDRNHTTLKDKVIAEACFSYVNPSSNWKSLCPGSSKTNQGVDEKYGTGSAQPTGECGRECYHGTHVAGEAALAYQDIKHDANDYETTSYGTFFPFEEDLYSYAGNGQGISGGARNASIISIQIFSLVNGSDSLTTSSAYIKALDWLAENADNRSVLPKPVAAANMSIGGGGYSISGCFGDNSLKNMFNKLKAKNIAVFISTGNNWNNGQKNNVGSPACVTGSIGVAALQNNGNNFAGYSQNGDGTTLLAIGGDASFASSGIVGYWNCPSGMFALTCSIESNSVIWGPQVGQSGLYTWTNMQGTSMASPYAAGIYTSLKSYVENNATVDDIANIMQITGRNVSDSRGDATTRAKPLVQGNAALKALSNQGSKPVIYSFKPSVSRPSIGSNITLSGKVSARSSCAINNKVGSVTVDGSGNFSASGVLTSETFALTCVNAQSNAYSSNVLNTQTYVFPSSITATPSAIELYETQNQQISVAFTPNETTNKQVEYTSSNPSVATVSADGKVTGVGKGTATITVKSQENSSLASTVQVTVKKHVTGVSVSASPSSIKIGDLSTLTVTITPTDASNTAWYAQFSPAGVVLWENINNGTVKGNTKGTATIIITTSDGSFTAQTQIIVTKPSSGIVVSPTTLNLYAGNSALLTPTIYPEDASDKRVVYYSDNPSVADVYEYDTVTGIVRGLANGSTTIRVRTSDGYEAICSVTVTQLPTSVTLSPRSATISSRGGTVQLSASVLPDSAVNKGLKWTSNNSNVATVDQSGLVTGLRSGTSNIRAVADESGQGLVTDYITVTVYQAVESITITPSSLVMEKNRGYQLSATVLPANAANTQIKWVGSSGNNFVVSSTGYITTTNFTGRYPVKAYAMDGGETLYAEISVLVREPVISFEINPSTFEMPTGGSPRDLHARNFQPSLATNTDVTWYSRNTNIATVDQYGWVTGVLGGEVQICAVNDDSGVEACSAGIVYQEATSISFVNSSPIKLNPGGQATVQANVLPDNARSKTIKFSSANSDIVSVDSSTGLLQANPSLTENSALFITAAALNGVKAQIEVQVKILPTDMTVTPSSAIIGIDGTFSIQVSAIPSAAGTQLYSYDSSNPLIATVKNNYGVGRVTGVNQGEAIITVYMVNTSISKTLSVSVRRAVTGVSLTPETNIVSIGQKLQLTHSVIPQNAYNTNVTYTSQSPDIAVVNLTGEVVGVSPGNTTITVSTNDGNFQAFSDVLVTKPVTGVVISPKSIILDKCIKELVDGEMIYIQCPHSQVSSLVSPIDATNLAVNYSSSDENIATVTKAGVIEGQNVGQANIVATTFDGSFTDVCQVTIKQTNVFVQGLAFSPQEVTVNKNEEVQLNPVFSPWQASDKSLTYTSANSSVATVSQTGLVKGVSQGITTITAKSNKTLDSSEVSAVAEISVEENFVAVTKITLSPKTHTLEPGETVQLVNVVEPANASDDTVSFASSNSAIASVSPTGLVTAQALGSATITVTTQDRGLTDTSIITVQPPYVAVTGFSLQPESQTLNIGEDQYLQSVILPDNASNIQVNFSSSNPDVATVTQTGLVVAVSSGSAVITGITADGNFQDTCLITVLVPLINVETVSLDKTSLTINIGETEKLIPAISPANATDKSVSWQSSNPSVATVDNQGLVSAVSYGKARIDAVTVDGGKIASCQVSVNVPEISVITVVLSPDSAIINIGQNLPLNTQVLPANASDKTVSYRSSNDQVVSVSQTGIVTGLSVGTATITVRTNDGNFEDTSQITVVQPFIPVESVTLTPSQISLNIGQTAQLSAVVLPDNATNKVVEYYSSDSAVATVSQTGLVTAISTGAAVITVETESGDYMDTAVVSVNQVFTPIIGVGIYPNKLTLNIGESQTVTASIVPNNATIKTVVWSSLDPIIASVDQAGEIFARSPGMVKIRAASIDGSDVFGEATVNVIEPTPIYMITDVSPTDQAWPSIEQMYIKKYTNGCSSQTVGNTVITKYCPSDSVKREQMAAFLYYLKGYPDYTPPAVSPFSDLKSDNQFYKQIMWGVANGVWSGYEDKTFKGSKAITRGQFVSVLWRFYGNPEPVLPPISPFSDIKSTDAIYKAIIWAKNNSITTGYEDGTFKPNKTCSRAQMAMFIIRSDKNARTYFE